jgi:thiosulfate/3-mercaptopyruvate sulfurtransferase
MPSNLAFNQEHKQVMSNWASGEGIGILSVHGLPDSHQLFQVVDARSQEAFESGHIPGAIWMGWEEWCATAPVDEASVLRRSGYWGALRQSPASWFADRLARIGLSSDDPVLVYADGPLSRGREGRIAWMLLYLGARTVRLLDGGWSAWLEAGGEVEHGATERPPGRFPVSFRWGRRRTVDQLGRQWLFGPRPFLVDTRSELEFTGAGEPYMPRRGHVPGAALVPFTSLFDAGGGYVDGRSYLEALPSSMREADDLVAYCEVGVRASLFALLHEAYTGRTVSVCDGSLMEWVLRPDMPLVTGTDT